MFLQRVGKIQYFLLIVKLLIVTYLLYLTDDSPMSWYCNSHWLPCNPLSQDMRPLFPPEAPQMIHNTSSSKNTVDFLKQLNKCKTPNTDNLISLDVNNMHGNIPRENALHILQNRLVTLKNLERGNNWNYKNHKYY